MIIHKDKIYQPIESQLYSSWEEIETVTQKPLVSWKAGKIPLSLWNDIKQICQHTNDEHNSECLIRLYFNSQSNEWKAIVHPQEMNGMTVSDDIDMDLVLSLGDGFAEAGSVHHHCTSSAFQSGTDEKDEEQQPGLHITIGSMSKDVYDIHARYRTSNSFLEPDMMTFFETPDWLLTCPQRYHNIIMSDLLVKCEDGKQAPKEWVANCKKKTFTYSTNYNYGGSPHYRNYYQTAQSSKPVENKREKADTEEITQVEYDELEAAADVFETSMHGEDEKLFDLIKDMYYDCNETITGIINLIDNPRSDEVNNYYSWDSLRKLAKADNICIHKLRKFIMVYEEELNTYLDYLDHTDFGYWGTSTNDKQTELGYL